MPTTTTEPRVSIFTVVDRLAATADVVRYWASRLDFELQPDWRGEESLTDAEAGKLVQEVETLNAEHNRRWAEYQAAIEDYERRKLEAGQEAYRKVVEARQTRDRMAFASLSEYATVTGPFYFAPSGNTQAEAREAREEAMAKFEKKNPRPTFEAPQ